MYYLVYDYIFVPSTLLLILLCNLLRFMLSQKLFVTLSCLDVCCVHRIDFYSMILHSLFIYKINC